MPKMSCFILIMEKKPIPATSLCYTGALTEAFQEIHMKLESLIGLILWIPLHRNTVVSERVITGSLPCGCKIKNGSQVSQLRYVGYEVQEGKYAIPGLPAVYAQNDEADTLILRLADPYSGLEVELYYGILTETDIITRAVKITNPGTDDLVLQKAASMNLDFEYGDFQWISFYGRHSMEMNFQKEHIHHGIQSVGSVRGSSSHQYNPFVILCEDGANETMGSCYGFSFVYSGEFFNRSRKRPARPDEADLRDSS